MATVEELVIELFVRADKAEQELNTVKDRVKAIEESSKGAKRGMDDLSRSAEKTGRSGEVAARGARKAGDEIEKAGVKARRSATLLDKVERRLSRGWIKAITAYAAGFLAAGTVIGFIKDSIGKTIESAGAIGKVAESSGRMRTEVHALGAAFRSLGKDEQSAYKYLEDFNNGKYDKAAATIGIRTQDKGRRRMGEDVLVEMGQKAVADSGGDKDLAAKRLQAIGLEKEAAEAAVKATKDLIAEKQRDGAVTDEQIRRAEEVSNKYGTLAGRLEDVKEAFGYGVLPIIEEVMDGIDGLLGLIRDFASGFEEASGGVGFFQTALEILMAPIQIIIGFVSALLEGLGGVSNWAQTGGQVVYGFFTLMQTVWNACILVINGMIAALEGLVNAIGQVAHAINDPFGSGPAYKPVKFGQVGYIGQGGGGGRAASYPVGGAGRGTVRGSWGMPSAGRGGSGRGGRGRSGGGGRRGGGGSAGKEEPIYRSTYQGTADPKRLGMQGAIGKIAEDPAKVAAKKAKKAGHGGMASGARQVASAAMQTFNFNNSINVYAQGNPNARDIATRTADAVNTVSRRQAGAMA